MYKYLDYLPEYLHEVKELQALDGCINPQMETINQEAQQAYSNQFLSSADLNTVKRWEKNYRIVSPESFSLSSRQLKLILKQSGKVPYTFNMLTAYLSQLFKNADVSRDFEKRQANIVIQMEDDTQVDNLYSTLRKMLPANMLIHITLRSEIAAQTYIGASMTSYSEETINNGFFTVLPAYSLKVGGALTDHTMEKMNGKFETKLSGLIGSGGGVTDYTKEAIS
nr:putative phage tail protein [uncultured Caproiciproducens sp.]